MNLQEQISERIVKRERLAVYREELKRKKRIRELVNNARQLCEDAFKIAQEIRSEVR